jgi:O-antigen ligase
MNFSLRQIYVTLFLIGIFFIPFNSYEGIKELGEFKKEASAIFLLVGFLVLLFDFAVSKRILLPYKSYFFQLLLIFFVICIASVVVNLPNIVDYYFKKTTGINRFIRQIFVLFLSAGAFFVLYWNVVAKMTIVEMLTRIRRAFLYSFIVVSIYGFFEILFRVFGFYPAYYVLRLFDFFPFTEYDEDVNRRISSVCFEAPALATFLITVAGWMFSYIITNKGYMKYIPTLIVIILTYFSGSRTALIVVLFQLIVFFSIILSRQQKIKVGLAIVLLTFVLGSAVVLSKSDKIIQNIEKKVESLDIKGNLKNNISNQSRIGIQYANLTVFAHNPIFGVGYGQQAFEAIHYYPIWAKKNNWEFKHIYLNKNDPMFPPGYNLYVRLLAETGIVGFSFFIFFLFTIVKRTRRLIFESDTIEDKAVSIIMLTTFVGFILNWLQLDTFRMYGFWLSLALLIKLTQYPKKQFV